MQHFVCHPQVKLTTCGERIYDKVTSPTWFENAFNNSPASENGVLKTRCLYVALGVFSDGSPIDKQMKPVVFTNYNFLRNDYPMVHYLFFFTPKEPKMVLLVSSEFLLLYFSTAVRYESANFFKLIPEGLSSDTKFSFNFLSILMHPEIWPRGA